MSEAKIRLSAEGVAEVVSAFKKVQAESGTTAASIKSLGSAMSGLKGIAASIGIGLSLNSFKNKIADAIESMAGLKQAAERTGASIEGLSAIKSIAKLSGTDFETVISGIQKLDKAMIGAQNSTSKEAEAFNALGISTKNIAKQKPDEVFLKIAKSLDKFEDGPAKAAIAMVLFGKAGANLLPVLKDLAEKGDLVGKVTGEEAKQADEFEKNMIRLTAASKKFYIEIAKELLPALTETSSAMVQAYKDSGVLMAAWVALGGLGKFLFTDDFLTQSQKTERTIAKLDGQIKDLEKGSVLDNLGDKLDRLFGGTGDDSAKEQRLAHLKELKRIAENDLKVLNAADKPEPKKPDLKFGDKEKSDSTKEFEKQAAAADKLIRELRADLDQVGMDNFAKETEKVNARIGEFIALGKTKQDQLKAEALAIREQIAARQMAFDMEKSWATDTLEDISEVKKAERERIQQLLDQTPTEQLEKERAAMVLLSQAYEDGRITLAQYLEATEVIKARIMGASASVQSLSDEINQAGQNAAGNFFDDLITGAKSASEAIQSFAKSVLSSFASIIARKLSEKLFSSLFGNVGSTGGSILGWLSGLGGTSSTGGGTNAAGGMKAPGSAAGGLIQGPGTGTSDSIPAMLSNREFVVRAAVVNQPGVEEMLRHLNSGMRTIRPINYISKPHHYAGGGLVGGGGGQTAGGFNYVAPAVNVSITPEVMHMSMKDWIEGYVAREMANR